MRLGVDTPLSLFSVIGHAHTPLLRRLPFSAGLEPARQTPASPEVAIRGWVKAYRR